MKKQTVTMGMPITIDIVDNNAKEKDIDEVLDYLQTVDDTFSTYKKNSEIEKINRGELDEQNTSEEMKKILRLAEETRQETNGYFSIYFNGKRDPSGIVKGYAIFQAADLLQKKGYQNFYINIAGDIQAYGKNEQGKNWKVGIENPFNRKEIIKVVYLSDKGIATSGTYIRGKHIWDPVNKRKADAIASISVIGPNVYEADRFATAAFAMGEKGIQFIENLDGFEAYMITKNKQGVMTSGFEKYLLS